MRVLIVKFKEDVKEWERHFDNRASVEAEFNSLGEDEELYVSVEGPIPAYDSNLQKFIRDGFTKTTDPYPLLPYINKLVNNYTIIDKTADELKNGLENHEANLATGKLSLANIERIKKMGYSLYIVIEAVKAMYSDINAAKTAVDNAIPQAHRDIMWPILNDFSSDMRKIYQNEQRKQTEIDKVDNNQTPDFDGWD